MDEKQAMEILFGSTNSVKTTAKPKSVEEQQNNSDSGEDVISTIQKFKKVIKPTNSTEGFKRVEVFDLEDESVVEKVVFVNPQSIPLFEQRNVLIVQWEKAPNVYAQRVIASQIDGLNAKIAVESILPFHDKEVVMVDVAGEMMELPWNTLEGMEEKIKEFEDVQEAYTFFKTIKGVEKSTAIAFLDKYNPDRQLSYFATFKTMFDIMKGNSLVKPLITGLDKNRKAQEIVKLQPKSTKSVNKPKTIEKQQFIEWQIGDSIVKRGEFVEIDVQGKMVVGEFRHVNVNPQFPKGLAVIKQNGKIFERVPNKIVKHNGKQKTKK